MSILQCQVTFLAGSDLDNVFDVVYENFSITDLTGMKNFLGGFDNLEGWATARRPSEFRSEARTV